MRGPLVIYSALVAAAMAAPREIFFNSSPFDLAEVRPTRRKRAIKLARSQGRRFRSKNAAGRPKKRPNMNHVSKRVRRKHRRKRAA